MDEKKIKIHKNLDFNTLNISVKDVSNKFKVRKLNSNHRGTYKVAGGVFKQEEVYDKLINKHWIANNLLDVKAQNYINRKVLINGTTYRFTSYNKDLKTFYVKEVATGYLYTFSTKVLLKCKIVIL